MEQYQREWDDDNKVFRQNPLHNWASHLADAFRYLSLAWREAYASPPAPKVDPKMPDNRMTLDMIRKGARACRLSTKKRAAPKPRRFWPISCAASARSRPTAIFAHGSTAPIRIAITSARRSV